MSDVPRIGVPSVGVSYMDVPIKDASRTGVPSVGVAILDLTCTKGALSVPTVGAL